MSLTTPEQVAAARAAGGMILNHAIKDAPKSRQHYDTHHYIPERREALMRWVTRLTKVLGHDPNAVMKAERTGFQGKGPARHLRRPETYRERKARLAAEGRDLSAERRQLRPRRQKAVRARLAAASLIALWQEGACRTPSDLLIPAHGRSDRPRASSRPFR